MKLFNKAKPEPVAPPPVFDYGAAEKAFLKLHQVQLTGSSLCVRKSGQLTPVTLDMISKFLRSYLSDLGQSSNLWRRDLSDDFLAFVKAGL